jgi:hypothetical protein
MCTVPLSGKQNIKERENRKKKPKDDQNSLKAIILAFNSTLEP